MTFATIVPWHQPAQIKKFLDAWGVSESSIPSWLFLVQDKDRSGCALTKNRGIRLALAAGAENLVIVDDDCFPHEEGETLFSLAQQHLEALRPQSVNLFEVVTDPPSRGTPYFSRTVTMPVAASMGYWSQVPDLDACGQLVRGALCSMKFKREVVFGKYFPLCGMNLAFPASAWPWCQFINVPRFDDIWQGFLWQKHAYSVGQCFNLKGPLVRHSRQSNVWANLRDEAPSLERNETMWSDIHASPLKEYDALKASVGM